MGQEFIRRLYQLMLVRQYKIVSIKGDWFSKDRAEEYSIESKISIDVFTSQISK